ncbi:MAG: BON domain-containing protein [Micavibrio sp.]
MNIKSVLVALALLVAAGQLSACTAIGLAAGAGATVGIASQQEGGISGAASDVRIKAMIADKWFKYKVDTFSKLSTTVDQGRVLITGVVQNPDDRVEAVRLAWQVEGVKQVINEIRVADSDGLPGYVRDAWITTRLRTALTLDKQVGAINYTIDTVQGTVYLMGVARNQAELDRVIETARNISNVKQVISYVKPLGEPVQDQESQPWLQP